MRARSGQGGRGAPASPPPRPAPPPPPRARGPSGCHAMICAQTRARVSAAKKLADDSPVTLYVARSLSPQAFEGAVKRELSLEGREIRMSSNDQRRDRSPAGFPPTLTAVTLLVQVCEHGGPQAGAAGAAGAAGGVPTAARVVPTAKWSPPLPSASSPSDAPPQHPILCCL